MSLRLPKEAILFYQMADISEENTITLKLKTAANQLSQKDILSLLTIIND
jgi:hypothetical protein